MGCSCLSYSGRGCVRPPALLNLSFLLLPGLLLLRFQSLRPLLLPVVRLRPTTSPLAVPFPPRLSPARPCSHPRPLEFVLLAGARWLSFAAPFGGRFFAGRCLSACGPAVSGYCAPCPLTRDTRFSFSGRTCGVCRCLSALGYLPPDWFGFAGLARVGVFCGWRFWWLFPLAVLRLPVGGGLLPSLPSASLVCPCAACLLGAVCRRRLFLSWSLFLSLFGLGRFLLVLVGVRSRLLPLPLAHASATGAVCGFCCACLALAVSCAQGLPFRSGFCCGR